MGINHNGHEAAHPPHDSIAGSETSHSKINLKPHDNISGSDADHSRLDLDVDALIVGGGFGGMYGLYKLRQLGLSVKLVEAGADFGGTWHWNRYPGARVDSEAPFYGFSIHEVWKTWNWKERFPDHAELRRYFDHVDKVLDLRKDSFFNTIVVDAQWNGTRWIV